MLLTAKNSLFAFGRRLKSWLWFLIFNEERQMREYRQACYDDILEIATI